jgi:Holliday junction resolvase
VQVLRKRGFAVAFVSGTGIPDLVVGKGEQLWWVEVKQPKGKFKPAQETFRKHWTGPQPITLRTVDEAMRFPE